MSVNSNCDVLRSGENVVYSELIEVTTLVAITSTQLLVESNNYHFRYTDDRDEVRNYLFFSDGEGQVVSGHQWRTRNYCCWPHAFGGIDVTQVLTQL